MRKFLVAAAMLVAVAAAGSARASEIYGGVIPPESSPRRLHLRRRAPTTGPGSISASTPAAAGTALIGRHRRGRPAQCRGATAFRAPFSAAPLATICRPATALSSLEWKPILHGAVLRDLPPPSWP